MKYSIALISFILLLGCTKFGKTYRVKGRVLNPVTGQGIQGAEVRIYKNTMELPGGSKMQKSAITDSEGNFDLSKLAFRTDKISVYSFPGEYYPIGWTQNNGQSFDMPALKMGKTMHADFYAVPYGEIKTSIHNINCGGLHDTLIFNRTYHSLSNVSVFQPFTLTGCINNNGGFAKVPSGDYLIEWTVIRNGILNSYSHILTVPPNGQGSYNIEY